jgi:hypothetical protein
VYYYRFAQLFIVAFTASTVFLRSWLHPGSLQSGRWYLSFLFYSAYFMMASGWSELSMTVGRIQFLGCRT